MANRRLFLILLTIVLYGFPSFAQGQTSSRVNWSEPELIDEGWWSNVTVDDTGTAHLGWYSANDKMDDFVMYVARPPGDERPEPVDVIVTSKGGYTVRNTFDVDSHGILHAYYRAQTSHVYAQAPANDAANANQWIAKQNIDSGYYLDLMVDRDDNVHLVSSVQGINLKTLNLDDESDSELPLEERFDCAFCADLIYHRSDDSGKTWSAPVNISQTIAGSERPQILQGNSGRIYITWSEGSDWYIGRGSYEDVRFVYSEDDGKSWQGPIILDGGENSDMRPTQFTLAELNDGSLMGVWRDGMGNDQLIHYQISENLGQTWTEPATVPFIKADSLAASTLDRYELLVDLQGIVHLFAVGYDAETDLGPALFELEFRQGRWLSPTRIFYDPDIRRPEWPQADVGPQNDLHLTFFIRVGNGRTAADIGDLYVYYTRRPGNLTDRTVLAAYPPTAVPLAPATEVPSFLPTPTLLPTLAPLDTTVVIGANQDLYAIETLLGAILAVGLLCIAVLILSGFRPRL